MYVHEILLLLYFIAMNGSYTALLFLSLLDVFERRASQLDLLDRNVLSNPMTPPIAILAPAYNEQATCEDSVRAFLQLEFPDLRVIVINDGSKDRTLDVLKERFRLQPIQRIVRQNLATKPIKAIYQSLDDPRLIVVDKENGGKADALNVGINVSRAPLVLCVDSDSLIDRKALLRMVEPFLYDPRRVVCVGGTVAVVNSSVIKDGIVQEHRIPTSWVARFQMVEYMRAFLFGRMGFNRLGGNLIISGAFGLFLREAIMKVGGFRHDTVGEDMELVVRLHRTHLEQGKPYRVAFLPDPICYTEVPETLKVLRKQRDRWHRGLADTLTRHRRMAFNPRYGRVGLIGVPFFLLFELFGPFVELGGYAWFAYTALFRSYDHLFAVLFFLLAFVWGFLLSVQSIVLDNLVRPVPRRLKEQAFLALIAFFEALGYRQLTILFRIEGFYKFLKGEKAWGQMTRKGFRPAP